MSEYEEAAGLSNYDTGLYSQFEGSYPIDGPNAIENDYILFTGYEGKVPGYTKIKSRGAASARATGTVKLYIPENVKNSTKSNYEGTNGGTLLSAVTNAGGNVDDPASLSGVKKYLKQLGIDGLTAAGNAAFGPIGDNAAVTSQAVGVSGAAANRHVLFQGVDYRQFTYQYNMMPKTAGESQQLTNIIKYFRTQMSPELTAGGNFFTPPNFFGIKYYIDGRESSHLNKIKPCVLTDCEVEYGGNGSFGMFRETGAPAVVNLTLTFQEVQLITKSDVQLGY